MKSILNRTVRKNGRFDEYCVWYFLDLHGIGAIAASRIRGYIYLSGPSDLLSRAEHSARSEEDALTGRIGESGPCRL